MPPLPRSPAPGRLHVAQVLSPVGCAEVRLSAGRKTTFDESGDERRQKSVQQDQDVHLIIQYYKDKSAERQKVWQTATCFGSSHCKAVRKSTNVCGET
eukprot:756146-Hanusia_phi.AAC.1